MKELSLHVLDIVRNSVEAGSKNISICFEESKLNDKISVTISDDGRGIPEEIAGQVLDPWTTTRKTRKIGMGLPLLKQHAEIAGGTVEVTSKVNAGTVIKAEFKFSHIDRQPVGDITGVLKILMSTGEDLDFSYSHSTDEGSYFFSTKEAREVLELDELTDNNVLNMLQQLIHNNLEDINAELI